MRLGILILLVFAGGAVVSGQQSDKERDAEFLLGLEKESFEVTAPLRGNSYGEGRRGLLAVYSPSPSPAPISTELLQVDSLAVNNKRCSVFWKRSRPAGKNPPNAAIRLALRTLSDETATQLGLVKEKHGGTYAVVRLSNLCTNPSPHIRKKFANRKRLRSSLTFRMPSNVQLGYVTRMRQKYYAHKLRNLAVAWGAGIWAPRPMLYKSGAQAVCTPQNEALSGKCGPKRWKPSRVTPV